MNLPYQILLDIWEGNPDLNADELKAAGVAGLIVRLNDMNGGHHMDQRFQLDWAFAAQFDVRSIYFVYNPWVSGKANFDWLIVHLPADFNGRLLIDTEVKYPGYPPDTYAKETLIFYGLVAAHFPQAIYTGEWFLPLVAKWPGDIEYWWAAYPDALQGHKTWESFKAAVEKMVLENWTKKSPGPAKLWQCSGGGNVLPGFGKHGVDISIFPGSLDELKDWLNPSDEEENMTTPYDNYALGIALDIGQTIDLKAAKAAGFSFVVQKYASDFTVNRDWATIVQAAANAGMPIFAEVVPYMTAVGFSQGKLAESYWLQHEYRFIDQAANGIDRKIAGIIVSAEVRDDGNGATVTESNTQATLEYLLNNYRAQLDDQGKTSVKVMLRSNDSYIRAIAPIVIPAIVKRDQFHDFVMADWRYRLEGADGKNTYGSFIGGIVEAAADIRANFGKLPAGFTTPPYPGSLYFWEIGNWWKLPFVVGAPRIVMAVGKTEAQLYGDLGFAQTEPPTPPIDPPQPPTDTTQLDRIEAALAGLSASVEQIKAVTDAIKGL